MWALIWDFLLTQLFKLPLTSKVFWQWSIEATLLSVAAVIAVARGVTLVEIGLVVYIFAGRRIIDAILNVVLPETKA